MILAKAATDAPSRAKRIAWRRILRFRLRHLMVLMLLTALAIGFWANHYRKRALVVDWLNDHVAYAGIGQDRLIINPARNRTSPPQALAVRVFGRSAKRVICEITIGTSLQTTDLKWYSDMTVPDATELTWLFSKLQYFPELRTLNLGRVELSDSAIESLAKLTQLEELRICESKFSEGSVQMLGNLTHLKRLEFTVDTLSDEMLQKLRKKLPQCIVYRSTPDDELSSELGESPLLREQQRSCDTTLLAPLR